MFWGGRGVEDVAVHACAIDGAGEVIDLGACGGIPFQINCGRGGRDQSRQGYGYRSGCPHRIDQSINTEGQNKRAKGEKRDRVERAGEGH